MRARSDIKNGLAAALLILGLTAGGCGDEDGPSAPDDGNHTGGGNTFTGGLDGTPWTSDADSIRIDGDWVPTREGALRIFGAESASGVSIALNLNFIPGPGSYPLGVNAMVAGGKGRVTLGTTTWDTPASGTAGFVVIDARTDTRVAGSFYFTAQSLPPADPDTVVTSGDFDITVATGLPPLPTDRGSVVTAELGGAFWYAASILGGVFAEAFQVSATGTTYEMTIASQAPIAAGNTYGIPSQVQIVVHGAGGSMGWWGGTGADVGTIVVEQLGFNRVVATFSAQLVPGFGVTTPLTVTGGLVDAYLSAD